MNISKEPILNSVVCEYAHNVDFHDARAKFVKPFWNIVNWDFAYRNLNN
jgi:Fe-Mn family superoxide dismutase